MGAKKRTVSEATRKKLSAAGKRRWRSMSASQQATVTRRLRGTRSKSRSPKASSGGTKMPKKSSKKGRRRPEPIPLVGVRGSSTMVSAPKVILAAGAITLATTPTPGTTFSPLEVLQGKGTYAGGTGAVAAVRYLVENRVVNIGKTGKTAAIVLGIMAVVGKKFDRRFRDFPIRLGK